MVSEQFILRMIWG